jgi:hypothetical protein
MPIYRRGAALRRLFAEATNRLPHIPRTWACGGPKGNECMQVPNTPGEAVGRINGHEVVIIARWCERNTLDGPAPVPFFRSRVNGAYVTRDQLYVLCGELVG